MDSTDAAPPIDAERDALALSADENASLCAGCTRCCETVSIEVDAPRAPWEYDQWIWVLHHRNLEIYVEKPEAWYLHIETKCTQLQDDGHCRIYGRHPVLCRQYDPRDCERRAPLSDIVAWFKTAEDLEAWLRLKRPAHWRRLVAHRGEQPPSAPTGLAAALVQIAGTAHVPATHLPPRETSGKPR